MQRNHPGEVEHCASFNTHLGGRFQSAGLRVQFHHNQVPGIHFKCEPPTEYANAILRGLEDGLAYDFPEFPSTASVWINEVIVHEVSSSEAAFYRAGLLVIRQARGLVEIAKLGTLQSVQPKA